MHVGIDCTTAESFIINSELFNSLDKEVIDFSSDLRMKVEEDLRKNVPRLYLRDGSESKELLYMIDKFISRVHECIESNASEVYLDDSQSKRLRGWLYKFYDNAIHIVKIISKDDKLDLVRFSTNGNVIFEATGYAVGLTETGLIKIKCTSHVDGYVYTR